MKKYLNIIGTFGSVFAALCCMGFPALVALLSALGLVFILNDAILLPLLLVFLIVGHLGVWFSFQRHHKSQALVLSAVSSIITFVFIFVFYYAPLVVIGICGLIVSAIWDFFLCRKCAV